MGPTRELAQGRDKREQPGVFVTSLDVELHWGIRDRCAAQMCAEVCRRERLAIPLLLDTFSRYGIHATWAIVGFLLCKDFEDFSRFAPANRPHYQNHSLSPYHDLRCMQERQDDQMFHDMQPLIEMMRNRRFQEIASHTFSHYYCLEQGQSQDMFREDLSAALRLATARGFPITTLVFPDNQINPAYLPICRALGVKAYRGNPESRLYQPMAGPGRALLHRVLRVMDAYIGLRGDDTYSRERLRGELPLNVLASQFMRPYVPILAPFEKLRLRRILRSLTWAAQQGRIYHLWWHPFNFGVHLRENFACLEAILQHYQVLHEQYGLESLNISECGNQILPDVAGRKCELHFGLRTPAPAYDAEVGSVMITARGDATG